MIDSPGYSIKPLTNVILVNKLYQFIPSEMGSNHYGNYGLLFLRFLVEY